jgi:hypothetical protein
MEKYGAFIRTDVDIARVYKIVSSLRHESGDKCQEKDVPVGMIKSAKINGAWLALKDR